MYGIDLRGLVTSQIATRFPIGSLTKVATGAYDIADPTNGAAKTPTVYPCRIQTTKYATKFIAGDLARNLTAQAIVFLGTLPIGIVPSVGDPISFYPPGATSPVTGVVAKVSELDESASTATVDISA